MGYLALVSIRNLAQSKSFWALTARFYLFFGANAPKKIHNRQIEAFFQRLNAYLTENQKPLDTLFIKAGCYFKNTLPFFKSCYMSLKKP